MGIGYRLFSAALAGWCGLALADTAALPEPVTLDAVMSFVRSHPEIRSIDDFLSRLPVSYRSQFTLMHTSNSLQSATPESPRGILFGPDARLLMAFTGDPNGSRGDSLELIGFHDDTAQFEMREIKFPEDHADRPAAQISEANPALCLKCHQGDPRPNWEHYNSWPGAFGSEDDELANDNLVAVTRLRDFVALGESLPRFRHLTGLKDSYEGGAGRTRVEHNIHFTERVASLNFRRVARLARATPHWQEFKYATLGAMWCGATIADFLPAKYLPTFQPYFEELHNSYSTADNIRVPFAARGISIADWYLDFLSVGKTASFGTPGWPYWEITGPLVEGDSDLLHYFVASPQSYEGANFTKAEPKSGDAGCVELAKRSQAALAALQD